jgi:hypothetical protein
MSNSAITIAIGLGGGALLWHLTRDQKPASSAPAAVPDTRASAPPRIDAPCSLKLDSSGITVDGAKVDTATAVERCKANGRAALVVSADAPAAAHAQLATALNAARIPFTVKAV